MASLEQFFQWKEYTIWQYVFIEPILADYLILMKQKGLNELEMTSKLLCGLLKDKKQEKELKVDIGKMTPRNLLEFGKTILEQLGLVQTVK